MRHIEQARGDLYAISDELDFTKDQLVRLPIRKEMAQTALLATLTASERCSDDVRSAQLAIGRRKAGARARLARSGLALLGVSAKYDFARQSNTFKSAVA